MADLLVFLGGFGRSAVEEMVAGAHEAITLDTLERAEAAGCFRRVIVQTDRQSFGAGLDGRVEWCPSQSPFHFGESLAELIRRYGIRRPFYIGGGSVPLLPAEALAGIVGRLTGVEHTVITNNLFSADLVAFTPGEAIEAIDLPPTDNLLAQLLRRQAGLREVCLERTAATQFDIDTPTDLLILQVHPEAGPHISAYLNSLHLDTTRLRAAMGYLTDPQAEVLVAGRVGSQVWMHLEKDTACRVRLFSEERGMRAYERDTRGQARSLLGAYLQEVGVYRFFRALGEMGNAVFIDSRVVFAHLGWRPSAEDRFLSDLGRVQEIRSPYLQEFTQGALEAPMPVILGGHSLVAGGLLALIDAAWLERDASA